VREDATTPLSQLRDRSGTGWPRRRAHLRAVSAALAVTPDQVRELRLHAQGLRGAPPRGRPVQRVDTLLRTLGAVQLDTISVLARSHELVAYARLGAVGRAAVERAYWGSRRAVEYWAHAACVVPIESWPWFAAKRRRYRSGVQLHMGSTQQARLEVLARLRDLGPLTATELGGAKNGGPWWDWSPMKAAAEQLLAEGEVVCVERRGWRRVYDLAERAIPAELRAQEPGDVECAAWLCREAARRLGIATRVEITGYFRIRPPQLALAGMAAAGLVPVKVAGWQAAHWAHPDAVAWLESPPRGRHRTALLSPFDSLLWDRPATQRLFDYHVRLEIYVPRAQRVHGYYAMPLLTGGRLRGRVAPARQGRTLVARQATVEPEAVEGMAAALVEAAGWVGCDAVAVELVEPTSLRRSLEAAVRRAG
jgi:uncharacterized protein